MIDINGFKNFRNQIEQRIDRVFNVLHKIVNSNLNRSLTSVVLDCSYTLPPLHIPDDLHRDPGVKHVLMAIMTLYDPQSFTGYNSLLLTNKPYSNNSYVHDFIPRIANTELPDGLKTDTGPLAGKARYAVRVSQFPVAVATLSVCFDDEVDPVFQTDYSCVPHEDPYQIFELIRSVAQGELNRLN